MMKGRVGLSQGFTLVFVRSDQVQHKTGICYQAQIQTGYIATKDQSLTAPPHFSSQFPQQFLSVGPFTMSYQLKYSQQTKPEAITLAKCAADGRQAVVTTAVYFRDTCCFNMCHGFVIRDKVGTKCVTSCEWYWEKVVTLWNSMLFFKFQWSLYVPLGLTFTILRSAHTAVFMCFVWISEQTAIISLYNIN